MEVAGPGPGSELERLGGRTARQLRGITCERGTLCRADGSATWSQDQSCVMAAVHGPRQAHAAREDAEQAIIEVVFKPRNGNSKLSVIQTNKDRDYEDVIRSTLEGIVPCGMHPRTSIMVVLQVLQDDGSLLACALNAAAAALADAGVPMTCMLAAATASMLPPPPPSGGQQPGAPTYALDPSAKEQAGAAATLTAAYPFHYDAAGAPVVGESYLAYHAPEAVCSVNALQDLAALCHAGCGQVAQFSRVFLGLGMRR